MIYIDFIPGTHGQYLDYMCNRYLTASAQLPRFNIFDEKGRAHRRSQEFEQTETFEARHLHDLPADSDIGDRVVQITFTEQDIFYVLDRYLTKAGRYNLDIATLSSDTVSKLNNPQHRPILDSLIAGWFQQQWHSQVSEATRLGYMHCQLTRLDSQYPDCPAWVLREFFKLTFDAGLASGLLNKLFKKPNVELIQFPMRNILDIDRFVNQMAKLSSQLGLELYNIDQLREEHADFLAKQNFKREQAVNQAVAAVESGSALDIGNLDWLQQARVWQQVELLSGRRLTNIPENFYTNTEQLIEAIHAC